jgi:hypothetical protein
MAICERGSEAISAANHWLGPPVSIPELAITMAGFSRTICARISGAMTVRTMGWEKNGLPLARMRWRIHEVA